MTARWCWCRTTATCCVPPPTSCCSWPTGAVEPFEGDLDDYREWLSQRRRNREQPPAKAGWHVPPRAAAARRAGARPDYSPSAGRLERQLAAVEQELSRLTQEKRRLERSAGRPQCLCCREPGGAQGPACWSRRAWTQHCGKRRSAGSTCRPNWRRWRRSRIARCIGWNSPRAPRSKVRFLIIVPRSESYMKRIFLFVVTNLAVLLVLSITARLLGSTAS